MGARIDISDFIKKIDAINKACKALPNELAAIAVNFSKDRFRDRAWLDRTKESWKPRKQLRKGGKKRSQHLLVNSARLKRSIRKIYADQNIIIIGTDVEYAEIHNNGGIIKKIVNVKQHVRKAHTRKRKGRKNISVKSYVVKAHTRTMNLKIPQRKFLGDSYTLQRRLFLHYSAKILKSIK